MKITIRENKSSRKLILAKINPNKVVTAWCRVQYGIYFTSYFCFQYIARARSHTLDPTLKLKQTHSHTERTEEPHGTDTKYKKR